MLYRILTLRCCLLAALSILTAGSGAQAPPVVVERDIVYGTVNGIPLKLDIASPASGDGPFPAVVWFHGGGWQAGRKSDNGAAIRELAQRGYVAASAEYRFAPRFPFPARRDCPHLGAIPAGFWKRFA